MRTADYVSEVLASYGSLSELLRFHTRDPVHRCTAHRDGVLTRILAGFSPAHLEVLRTAEFVIFKPDAVASGKVMAILDRLASAGIGLLWARPLFGFNEHHYEELYRYNIDLDHPKTMVGSLWLQHQPFARHTAVAALIGSVDRARYGDVYLELKRLKGESTPYLSRPGQIRFDLNGSSKTLNLLHVADDPISSLREMNIFCEREETVRVLDEIARLTRARSPREIHDMCRGRLGRMLDVLGPSDTDADFPAATLRTAAKLACAVGDRTGRLLDDGVFDPPPEHLGPHLRAIELRDRLVGVAEMLPAPSPRARTWKAAMSLELLRTLCGLEEWSTEKIAHLIASAESMGIHVSDWDALMMSSNALFIDALRAAVRDRTSAEPISTRLRRTA
jgi:nucleoside diphosphate kinase